MQRQAPGLQVIVAACGLFITYHSTFSISKGEAMLCFEEGNHRFNYRVAGVAIVDGSVLIHRGENEPFWSLPGGRGEFFEFSRDTLAREIREELETDVVIGRLLWIAENFYDNVAHRYHELAWYYEITLPDRLGPFDRPPLRWRRQRCSRRVSLATAW